MRFLRWWMQNRSMWHDIQSVAKSAAESGWNAALDEAIAELGSPTVFSVLTNSSVKQRLQEMKSK